MKSDKTKKIKEAVPEAIIWLFFCFSIVLSVSVAFRLFLTVNEGLKDVGIYSYILIYFILPIISSITILVTSKKRTLLKGYFSLFIILIVIDLVIAVYYSDYAIFPEYTVFWLPIPLMLLFFSKENPSFLTRIKKQKVIIAMILIIGILLPCLVVSISTTIILDNAKAMPDNSQKASFISRHIIQMNNFGSIFRSNNDFWKFVLTGVGSCGEIAMGNIKLLTDLGIETRKIEVSGENHAFTEVKVGEDWKVLDGMNLQSRQEWFGNRTKEIGCVTYLCTITNDSYVELIQGYTNRTDLITIRVTENEEPIANAHIQLKHTFYMENGSKSILQTLPSPDRSFVSDSNGTVSLHLGKPLYIGEFSKSDAYYWVFVNNVNKTSVSSQGLGINQPVLNLAID